MLGPAISTSTFSLNEPVDLPLGWRL